MRRNFKMSSFAGKKRFTRVFKPVDKLAMRTLTFEIVNIIQEDDGLSGEEKYAKYHRALRRFHLTTEHRPRLNAVDTRPQTVTNTPPSSPKAEEEIQVVPESPKTPDQPIINNVAPPIGHRYVTNDGVILMDRIVNPISLFGIFEQTPVRVIHMRNHSYRQINF